MIEIIGTALVKGVSVAVSKNVATSLISKLNGFLTKHRTSEAIRDLEDCIHPPSESNASENNKIKEKIYNRYLKFRTLIQPEKRVFVDDIYHPLSLLYKERNGITHKVDDDQILFLDKVTIIVGKAGQGKTTTLRKIVLREMLKDGGYIPLIITLRMIEWEKGEIDICKIVSEEFREIGVTVHENAVPRLLQSKSILLCFDGFDEVPTEYRASATRLIRQSFHSQNSPCIVTTRPHTEILYEQGSFEIAELLDLKTEEVTKIIQNNNILDTSYKDILVQALKNNPEINTILLTPILVDIYMSVFGNLKSTPKSEIDFYDELFWSLVNKHDRFKAFVRPSKSGLTLRQLHTLFLRVSALIALKEKTLTFSEHALENLFSNCADKLQYLDHRNASHFDIIDKTSLIIADGNDFSYIHKTILEYHAALWIKSIPINERSKLYKKFADKYDTKYESILRYSSKIDSAAFYEHFAKYIIDKTEIMRELSKGVFSEQILGLLNTFNIITVSTKPDIDDFIISKGMLVNHGFKDTVQPLVALREILNLPINNTSQYCDSLQKVYDIVTLQDDVYLSDIKAPRYNINSLPDHEKLKNNLNVTDYYYKVLDIMNYAPSKDHVESDKIQINFIKSCFHELLIKIELSIAQSSAESDIDDLL